MGSYGIKSTGFVKPTLTDLKKDIGDAYKAIYGTPNLADDSIIGIRIGIMAKQLADAWETLEATYGAPFPATGDDVTLPQAMDLVGLQMLLASKSIVTCQCSGTNGTVIPAGTQIANENTQEVFELTVQVTIPAGGVVDGIFEAAAAGPANVAANAMKTILNPVSGWDSVDNEDAGTTGRNAETVAEARLRRAASLQVIGGATIGAIVARVLNEVPGVTDCLGFTNRTMATDSDGRPAKSNEILVAGGLDADIGQKLWDCTAGGIELYGTTQVPVLDSQGNTQYVYYTKPTPITVDVTVNVDQFNPKKLPANFKTLIANAVVAYAADFQIGQDLITSRWDVPCYRIEGVEKVVIQHKRSGSGYTSDDIVMAYNEQTVVAFDNVHVTGGPS
jgi:uncharacterized phage protein gp47/JayE